jgi:hypothetical protein
MFKLRSMMEDVAEKLFGRLLPQVEARAGHNCTPWEPDGCCGPTLGQFQLKRYCPPDGQHGGHWQENCTGICPA